MTSCSSVVFELRQFILCHPAEKVPESRTQHCLKKNKRGTETVPRKHNLVNDACIFLYARIMIVLLHVVGRKYRLVDGEKCSFIIYMGDSPRQDWWGGGGCRGQTLQGGSPFRGSGVMSKNIWGGRIKICITTTFTFYTREKFCKVAEY